MKIKFNIGMALHLLPPAFTFTPPDAAHSPCNPRPSRLNAPPEEDPNRVMIWRGSGRLWSETRAGLVSSLERRVFMPYESSAIRR